MPMPKGYYTEYSYCGFMLDGSKRYFATEKEYVDELREEVIEAMRKASIFCIFFNALNDERR